MTDRLVRVYRLAVTLPEGSTEPGWEPEGWYEICEQRGWVASDRETGAEYDPPFAWPRRKLYLSKLSAETRAKLLRSYGATVEIEESEPVAWPHIERMSCGCVVNRALNVIVKGHGADKTKGHVTGDGLCR